MIKGTQPMHPEQQENIQQITTEMIEESSQSLEQQDSQVTFECSIQVGDPDIERVVMLGYD